MNSKRALDFFLYVLVAVVSVVLVLFAAANTAWLDNGRLQRWGGLVIHTLIVFGYAPRWSRAVLRQPAFWIVVLGALGVHLTALISVLLHVSEWKLMWFVFLAPIEIVAIGAVLNVATRHDQEADKSERAPTGHDPAVRRNRSVGENSWGEKHGRK